MAAFRSHKPAKQLGPGECRQRIPEQATAKQPQHKGLCPQIMQMNADDGLLNRRTATEKKTL